MAKNKSKANLNTIKHEKLINRLRVFIIATLTIIIFYPPYLQGLFFEKHVLPTQIIVFILFIIFYIYKWLRNENLFFKSPIEYVAFGFVVVYFISIFVAVHTRSAIVEWLKYCMYFAVFYMISEMADSQKVKRLFLGTIVASSLGVSIIGLDSSMGGKFVSLLNKFFNILGVEGNLFFGLFVDNRINSTLQYPNAMASYVMAIFFIVVGLLMVYKKWWQKAILGSSAFILFVTFMLTHSRGAQLLFPVAVVIFVLISQKGTRVKAATYISLSAFPAGVVGLLITPYLSADIFNPKALLFLLVGMLVTVGFCLIVEFLGNLLQKVNWKVYVSAFSVALIAIVIGLYTVINASVPVELSLEDSEQNKTISISKNVALQPNKEYILRFNAEGKMVEEKSYAYFVRVFSRNEKNIMFGGNTQLVRVNYPESNGTEEIDLLFTTPDDSKLTGIYFSIYYAGTSVKIDEASIIDAETGKTVKNIMFKNKYNLDRYISRFENILLSNSLIARMIFYKDGIEIFKDRWFLGAGGGAWNYLYRQYQSYSYASSQAHNYPLQLGIETGAIGIITLICLVVALVIAYLRYYRKTTHTDNDSNAYHIETAAVITAIAALFMHSVIDFDFSESSMLLLFWQCIALYNRELKDNLAVEDMRIIPIKRNKKVIRSEGKAINVIGIVISLVALYFASTFFISSSFAQQAFESLQNGELETGITKMDKAINLDKYNEQYVIGYTHAQNRPDLKTGYTDLLFLKNDMLQAKQGSGDLSEQEGILFQKQFSKAVQYINKLEKKAENNLNLTSNLASYNFKTGETEKGLSYLNSAINLFPFEPSLWHSKVDVYYQLMRNDFNNEEYDKAEEYLLKGLNVINEATEVNRRNMNPFVLNEETIDKLQTMQFIKDYWEQKEYLLKVNEIEHYTIPYMDVDLDGIPDQWVSNNTELITIEVEDKGLSIQANDEGFFYTNSRNYLNLEEGKKYSIEVILDRKVEAISFYISGIKSKTILQANGQNKYIGEFLVEKEPNKNGNQFGLYVGEDCSIKSIIVFRKE
jgi:O-antigen ligase/tetratricopeptide (TPR) repeat protein